MEKNKNLEQKSEDSNEKLHLSNIISNYENKETRPLKFGELCLILTRFQIMMEEEPTKYTIEEFIQQEDFRRDMFS